MLAHASARPTGRGRPASRHAGALGALMILALLATAASARDVILLIGDGMGFNHVAAGRAYCVGTEGALVMEQIERHGQVSTHAANAAVTDSAASATALATGVKSYNGAIAVAMDGSNLETILEIAKAKGMATGLVSTARITHATPAAFGAHEASRNSEVQIAQDLVRDSQPDVMLGGGSQFFGGALLEEAAQAGYEVITTADELGVATAGATETSKTLGLFSAGYMTYEFDRSDASSEPHLSEMVASALDMLSVPPNGFFLMVEAGRIDHGAHANHLQRTVLEVEAFDAAIEVVQNWTREGSARQADTLVLITADHETGGLSIQNPDDTLVAGEFVRPGWSSTGHTAADVPIWGFGPGSEAVQAQMDNIDIFPIMLDAMSTEPGTAVSLVGKHLTTFGALKRPEATR